MSMQNLEIDRLEITVHGVAAGVVEEAVAGLEAALNRRLGGLRGGFSLAAVPTLQLAPVEVTGQADPAALRELLAGRLLEALQARPADGEEG